MDNTRNILSVLNTDESWVLDHEEVVQDSVFVPVSESLPGHRGVMGSGQAVQFPGGAPQCLNPERVEGVNSLPDPPGGQSSGIITGSRPTGDVQNHFQGGSLAPPQSSSVCQDGVTRVEVTTGRGSKDKHQPFEHARRRLGLTLPNASVPNLDRGASITVEDYDSRDRNYASHTTRPHLQYSVQNNVQNIEDRAKIDAFLTQVGYLTEEVGNLRKENAAIRIALQHSNLDTAADSGRGIDSSSRPQSDPISLPASSNVGQNKTSVNFLPNRAVDKPMHIGTVVDSQGRNIRVAQNFNEDVSIHGEDGNASRYDLVVGPFPTIV